MRSNLGVGMPIDILLVRPDALAGNRKNDSPYGHRRFLLGAAVGLAGRVSTAVQITAAWAGDAAPVRTASKVPGRSVTS